MDRRLRSDPHVRSVGDREITVVAGARSVRAGHRGALISPSERMWRGGRLPAIAAARSAEARRAAVIVRTNGLAPMGANKVVNSPTAATTV